MSETKIVIGGGSGVGFLALLGLLFIGLKLGHVIEWSWLWVTCPLWGGFAAWALMAGLTLFFALIVAIIHALHK